MVEQFIERGTDYPLRNGTLSVYETNCSCKDIKFYFDQYVLTLMLTGHKTILTDNLKFEFFPGTFYIPEKETITNVSIPNASIDNPTKCLVLRLNSDYLKAVYEEVLCSQLDKEALFAQQVSDPKRYFFSNDKLLIEAFTRLYKHQFQDSGSTKDLIEDLIIKEMLYRIFKTEGLYLLQSNFEQTIGDSSIERAIRYIKKNIQEKLTAEKLAKVSSMGQTTFFKKFKRETGQSPIDFILHERIKRAKIMILKNKLNLQEVAFRCGFNSYEYFCSSFKKLEQIKPTDFKKSMLPKRSEVVG